jgi:hypothetical protein
MYLVWPELTIQPRLASNSPSSCLSLPSARITGIIYVVHFHLENKPMAGQSLAAT